MKDMVKVAQAANKMEAEIIFSLLQSNGIPAYIEDKESGSYMNLCMGYSIFGEDIYVNPNDTAQARELMDRIKNQPISEEELEREALEAGPADPPVSLNSEWDDRAREETECREQQGKTPAGPGRREWWQIWKKKPVSDTGRSNPAPPAERPFPKYNPKTVAWIIIAVDIVSLIVLFLFFHFVLKF